jgi:uncharacterized protein involved in cysteine biosynthesis
MHLGTIFAAFFAALGQIGDRRFARVFWMGVALSFALLIAATALFLTVLGSLTGGTVTLPLIGPVTWVGDLISWAGFGVALLLSVFLMAPVASSITSMFLDTVADAVEARHYPHLPPATPLPFATAVRDTVNYLGVMIGMNIVAIVLYIVLPFGTLFIFWALNGFLLGREYAYLAAMRREGPDGARAFWKRHRGTLWLAGVLMAIPLTVPVLNLAIPILGAATFTQLYHRLR